MTRKKEIKKRKRAKRKRETPQARFHEKIMKSEDLSPSLLVVEPEGQARMSEVILDFAEPLLEKYEDEKSFRDTTDLAIMVWNLSLLPENEQEEEIEQMHIDFMALNDQKIHDELMGYVNLLLERKTKHFSDNRRAIVKYQISGSGKNLRLDVASTLSF